MHQALESVIGSMFVCLLEIEGLTDTVNDKVVADKKKKLLETLNRILGLYVSLMR